MSKKKGTNDSLPLKMESDSMEQSSTITYASEVVAIIAGLAAKEVEGIAGMCTVSGSLMGKNKSVTRGVKVEVGTEEVSVDLYVVVEYGTPIQRAARDAQESVKKSIESMTGLHVVRVDVHVQGVSFEKEMKALQAGAGNANLASGESEEEPAKAAEQVKPEEPVRTEEPAADGETAEEPETAPAPDDASEPVEMTTGEDRETVPEAGSTEPEESAGEPETAEEAQV